MMVRLMRFSWLGAFLTMAITAPAHCQDSAPGEDEPSRPSRVYFGTYTGSGSDGIYVADFDATNGELGTPRLAAETHNPSFLTLGPSGQRLYSVTEARDDSGRRGAAIVAWRINPEEGTLSEVGRDGAGGDGPCFVAVSNDGRFAAVANYGGGSVAVFKLDADGKPTRTDVVQHQGSSAHPQRQGEPHAHSVQFTEDGRQLMAADLGTDELIVYELSDEGKLSRNEQATFKLPAGYGPRHFAFSPDQRFVLVINELSSMITVLRYDSGAIESVGEYSTLPQGHTGNNSTAEIQFHPSGQYVYGSNRGHDSLAVFMWGESGKLTPRGHASSGGKTPRNFRPSPDGKWLIAANQDSDNLVVFRIGEDGMPLPTGTSQKLSKPVCIKFTQ